MIATTRRARRLRAAQRPGWMLAAAIFITDRIVKLWVLEGLDLQPGESIPLLPIFSLTFVWNEGISLGLFPQETLWGRGLLIAATSLVALFLAVWLRRTDERLPAAALGLIIGGALGNIWDRLQYGAVADFFHVHVANWSFYIFNVADAAITIGVVLLLLDGFRSRPARG